MSHRHDDEDVAFDTHLDEADEIRSETGSYKRSAPSPHGSKESAGSRVDEGEVEERQQDEERHFGFGISDGEGDEELYFQPLART